MIPSTLRIALLIGIGLYFILIFGLLKRGALSLKYTLVWLLSGIVMLALTIWPSILYLFAKWVGIQSGMNGLFAAGIGFMLIILMTITSIVSNQRNKIKILTQEIAFLEKRVRELEDKQNA